LIDSDNYLFTLYKYIELNPIKANMVNHIADYKWSSYRHNALGQTDSLITEHKLYKYLGASAKQCCENYQAMFDALNITKEASLITEATMRGAVYGNGEFHRKISKLISRSTRLTSHGGDRKSEKYQEQAG
jgi:putative transposase